MLRKVKVFVLPYAHDNGDDNLSTAVDFHVGNVEFNCKQFEKFENEANSNKENQMTTSESHSKVIQKSNQLMFQFEMYICLRSEKMLERSL